MMNKNKGVALLLALFTLLIISLLFVAFVEFTTTDLQITQNLLYKDKALYIADAGVEYAIARLRGSRNGFSRRVEFPSGSGDTYSVTYSSSSGTITSMGSLSSGEEVSLEVKVSVSGESAPYRVKILYWREL